VATVSGHLFYDGARSNATAGLPGIVNVPIVLENVDNGLGLAVLTSSGGVFSFTNVPYGNYAIVEAFGDAGPFSLTGNFGNEAVARSPAIPAVPPLEGYVANPPAGATGLDCVSRNTILVTVPDSGVTGQHINNGPVQYSPIQIQPTVTVDWTANLINDADGGSFGGFTAGTSGMTGANPNPYPNINPGFTYTLPVGGGQSPIDGEFTIQNILNNNLYNQRETWWRVPDRTTGNETGRMMVINGANIGGVFFRDTVAVVPNTYYIFLTWILNLIKVAGRVNPQLAVTITAQDGTVLYDKNLGADIPANLNQPEWRQIGTLINSGNNSEITVEFYSMGNAASGNDYAIDDVGLFPAVINPPLLTKAVSATDAVVGDEISFQIVFENNTATTKTNIIFQDVLPNEVTFVSGSVEIGGVAYPDYDPNSGFSLPDLPPNNSISISFSAKAVAVGRASNTAEMTYQALIIEGVAPVEMTIPSNTVDIDIRETPKPPKPPCPWNPPPPPFYDYCKEFLSLPFPFHIFNAPSLKL